MNGKSIALKIFFGIACVGMLAACIVFLLSKDEAGKKEAITVNAFDESSVVGISVSASSDGYCLKRTAEGWIMDGYEGIKVKTTFAESLLKSMCNITSPMKMEDGFDMSLYGLDEPDYTVSLIYDGYVKNVYIGSSSGEYRYLTTDDADGVYIVLQNDLYMVLLDKIKYLDDTLFLIDSDLVTAFAKGDVKIVKNGDIWQEEAPYEHRADDDKVRDAIDAIADIRCVDIMRFSDVEPKNGIGVKIAGADEDISFEVYPCDENYSYIKKDGNEYLYKVENTQNAFLSLDAFDVLYKYIAPIPIGEVSGIRLISPAEETVILIEAPSTQAPVFFVNGKEAEETSFRSFYQSLVSLMLTKTGTGKGECEYEIIFEKENKEIYYIGFLDSGKDEFLVDINGRTDFVINKKAVTDVFEKVKYIETVK